MALVLTRRPGEAINIGEDVAIVVSRITVNGQEARRAQVALAITAPKDVVIVRSELEYRPELHHGKRGNVK